MLDLSGCLSCKGIDYFMLELPGCLSCTCKELTTLCWSYQVVYLAPVRIDYFMLELLVYLATVRNNFMLELSGCLSCTLDYFRLFILHL